VRDSRIDAVPGLTSVFLDRDGVINVKAPEGDYVKSWDEWELLPGALEGIGLLRDAGMKLVVVTNQRGVALGRMTRSDVEDIHLRMRANGVDVDAVYYCPHEKGECDCRKPGTAMFERAAREVAGVELGARAAIVGDSESDMEAGRRLGLVLVKVGEERSPVDHACGSLLEAARWLTSR
jgi:D-glycero-D-manno-heptose 1,7-bisphosphate phosphatase